MSHIHSTINPTERERGKHLNFEDRCSIQVCRRLGFSLRKTASMVNCSASTVLNELKRGTRERKGNRGRKPGYSAKRGQDAYEKNRSRCGRKRSISADNPFVAWAIEQVRTRKWSLDACVGYARKHQLFSADSIVCSKTLYNAVWEGIILSPFDLPEALGRNTRKRSIENTSAYWGTASM